MSEFNPHFSPNFSVIFSIPNTLPLPSGLGMGFCGDWVTAEIHEFVNFSLFCVTCTYRLNLLTLAYFVLHVHIDYTSVTSHERLNATKAQARGIPLPRINPWKRENKHVELNWSTR